MVTPSRVCELKSLRRSRYMPSGVTPSRVCELKYDHMEIIEEEETCHTLTGV